MAALSKIVLSLIPASVASSDLTAAWNQDAYLAASPERQSGAAQGTDTRINVQHLCNVMSVVPPSNKVISLNKDWTPAFSKRFSYLAARDAMDETSVVEKEELDALTKLRRTRVAPRTGSEIIADYRLRHETLKVLSALTDFFNYVGEHGASKKD